MGEVFRIDGAPTLIEEVQLRDREMDEGLLHPVYCTQSHTQSSWVLPYKWTTQSWLHIAWPGPYFC